jgi:predicted Rossmann fold flavoprotein
MNPTPRVETPSTKTIRQDILVIGGGAAGFFGAITAAESNPGLKVTILEKGTEVLSKVRISGGGRCNVTHACFDPVELVKHYPRGHRELLGPFYRWQPSDTVTWFESRGVPLKAEADGRMFPISDQSSSIVECLLNEARSAGVSIRTNQAVAQIKHHESEGFEVNTQDGHIYHARKILWATGGLKPGPAMKLLSQWGHHMVDPIPSLFTFQIKHPLIEGLPGLSVDEAEASLCGTRISCRGPLLVTHWGLSGPAILRLSAWGAREIHQAQKSFACDIDWIPNVTDAGFGLESLKKQHPSKQLHTLSPFDLPKRLWQRLLDVLEFNQGMTWRQLNSKQVRLLTESLKRTTFHVSGKSRNKEEFVTCGGVDLKEVQFKTMESKKLPGLHFAGEILDIDAETGGFNFQAAWTTGYLAGKAIAGSNAEKVPNVAQDSTNSPFF